MANGPHKLNLAHLNLESAGQPGQSTQLSQHLGPAIHVKFHSLSSAHNTTPLCCVCSSVPLHQFLNPKWQGSKDSSGDRVGDLVWDLATLSGRTREGGHNRSQADKDDEECDDESEGTTIYCMFCSYLSKVLAVSSTSHSYPPDFSSSASGGGWNGTRDRLMIDGKEIGAGKISGCKDYIGEVNGYFRQVLCFYGEGLGPKATTQDMTLEEGPAVAGDVSALGSPAGGCEVRNNGTVPEVLTFSHTVQLLVDGDGNGTQNNMNMDEDDLFKVRKIGKRVDVRLLRHWLRRCEEQHDGQHSAPGFEHNCDERIAGEDGNHETVDGIKNTLPIFLVDVERRCLTRAPSTERYLALSYVWGKMEQLRLTSENLQWLTTPGAMSWADDSENGDVACAGTEPGAQIPRTIRDAIRLCQMLGERYLWVDSLCIVQDDTLHKAEQLRGMGTIYNCATMTIVAANGSDASAPLPGVSSDRDLEAMGILTADLVIPGPSGSPETISVASRDANWINGVAESSVWYTRAWTLQEMLLSRRLMVFTPSGHVLFRCRNRLWLEDIVLDDVTAGNCFLRFGAGDFLSGWNMCDWSNRSYENGEERAWWERWTYPTDILLARDLSYDDDILNAASGILSALEHRLGETVWGHPKRHFGLSLLWTQHQKSYPLRRRGFPSWSWTGWKFNAQEKISQWYRQSLWDIIPQLDQEAGQLTFWQYDTASDHFTFFPKETRPVSYYALPDESYEGPRSYLDCVPGELMEPIKEPSDSLRAVPDVACVCSLNWTNIYPCSQQQKYEPLSQIEQQLRVALKTAQSSTAPPVDPSQLVFFWTSTARFEVETTMTNPSDVWGQTGHYRVFAIDSDNQDKYLGSIHLDPHWRASRGAKLDFIALAVDKITMRQQPGLCSLHNTDVFVMVVDWGGTAGTGSVDDQADGGPGYGHIAYRVAVLDEPIPADIWRNYASGQRLVVLG
ncbi:Heterokaryon incompatibility protein (HET) domain containing protein [Naviculisporaceae sp. PSN 640]